MIEVSCAIIVDKYQRVLVTQRSIKMNLPLKWEFPGGKIEIDESAEDCVKREIKEELNVEVSIIKKLPENTHVYPSSVIKLIPFVCELMSGTIQLKEHLSYKWLSGNDLLDLDWAEADIPVVNHYLIYLNAKP